MSDEFIMFVLVPLLILVAGFPISKILERMDGR